MNIIQNDMCFMEEFSLSVKPPKEENPVTFTNPKIGSVTYKQGHAHIADDGFNLKDMDNGKVYYGVFPWIKHLNSK
jgi:hypothetical protein